MNKSDCIEIAYLLNAYHLDRHEGLLERFFEIDSRIKDEYGGWHEAETHRELVMECWERKMHSEFGANWCVTKKELIGNRGKELMTEAQKEIYGEDYHPSLFK